MKIRLLAFASAGDALGGSERQIELPAGSRVGDLAALLRRDFPALEPLWPRLAVAVDGELAGEEEPLGEGAEVALLPPVSGGSGAAGQRGETGEGSPKAVLTDGPIDPAAVTALVAARGRGAVVLFLGTVRDHHRGRAVELLTYSAYRPMALARLERIVAELEAGEEGLAVAIVHRLGTLEPGEASVAIAAASPHRAAAYRASRTALERLKAEVPIWKREHYAGGEARWREEECLVPEAPSARPLSS